MHTDDILTRGPIGEEDGHSKCEPWDTVRPSTGPALSRVEHDRLPPGIVIVARWPNPHSHHRPYMVGYGGEHHLWRMGAWGPPIRSAWDRCLEAMTDPPEVHLPRLPRLSFALTTEAVRKRQKTVTRRQELPSWWREGVWFLGVDKIRQAGAQGLCVARCGPATKESLVAISQSEVDREGFPHTTPEGFCAMFREKMPRSWDGWVWRLPYTYLEIPT